MNPDKIEMVTSFGYWVRRRRKALDLTQSALAQTVGCALITLKKIEGDERRPSPQMAERLADYLAIPLRERDQFLRMARGEFVPAVLSASAGVEAHFFKHNLPAQATPFIGREKELADITCRLLDPTCRLLTLVGPGGIGKTRLALQAAQRLVEDEANRAIFAHGIVFIPLLPVSSLGGLISAIAEAANFNFYSNVSPRQQLLDYLREKATLLVLDNFEHLLALPKGGISRETSLIGNTGPEALIAEILRIAPAVKILVTSREALNLQEAWFHPVDGLSFPREDLVEAEAFETYDAVRLFVQSARRAQGDFSSPGQQQNIIRICHLVEGMPLAIELATAWLKMLSCDQIVTQIEQNLGFLATQLQNVPERHWSIRAVFEHSWNLLSETEQGVLKRLSVFRGGIGQEAAEHVAGATLLSLRTLVEKSLLRPTESGQYKLHELLRQFATEKLQANPDEYSAIQEDHCCYYLALLKARAQLLKGKQQQTALAEIAKEIENVRAGWIWAVDHGQINKLDQALEGFYNFYQIAGRYQEGEETFGYAAMALQQSVAGVEPLNFKITHTRILTRWGAFQGFLGLTEPAKNRLQIGLTLAQELGDQREVAFCLNLLGYFTGYRGHYPEARRLIQQSLTLSRALADQEGMALTLHNLAEIAQFLGENEEAKWLAQESLAFSRILGRQDWIAYGLDRLGFNTFARGEFAESEQYYQEGLAIFEEIGNKLGTALTLGGLGWVAWAIGGPSLDKARALGEKSLAVVRDCGHRFHIATRLGVLGQILNGSGQPEQAQQLYLEGLTLSKELAAPVPMALCLGGLGDVKRQLEDLQASKKHLLEALEIGAKARLLPHTSEALLYYATLLAQESDGLKEGEPTRRQKQSQALELTGIILHQPACWQVFKDKAAGLKVKLETHLPEEIAAAAWLRGKSRTLEAVVAEILEVNHV